MLFFLGMDQLLRSEFQIRAAVACFAGALAARVLFAMRGACSTRA